MRIKNNSRNRIAYHEGKALKFINVGEIVDVDTNIAKIILKIKGVEEYLEQKKDIEEDNVKANIQPENDKENELDTLKSEADKLGIKYSKNIKADTLRKKIEEYKANN